MSKSINFGTDGIRGPYGQYPLDPESLKQIAQAMAVYTPKGSIAIARDTRYSGLEILDILVQELIQYGITTVDCGILPTAALACVVVDDELDLGVVITASHNPYTDNGIKLFSNQGTKLSEVEQARFQKGFTESPSQSKGFSTLHKTPTHAWMRRLPKPNLQGIRILLDCAHGSLAPYGKSILEERGAKVTSVGCSPNGTNINEQVGALYPPTDIGQHELALCFDGDADRLIMCSSEGILDGDDLLFLMRKSIEGPLVGTIMSNGGLDKAVNGRLLRSKVGDKHVAALMKEHNAKMGAEPSGHIIFSDGDMPAGDGMYAALRILEQCGRNLKVNWKRWPTAQTSIRFKLEDLPNQEKPSLLGWNSTTNAHETGHRTVVRYSGTEPKLRILVEGPKAEYFCEAIKNEFRSKISQTNS